jgi:hypothetical protein
MRGRVIQRMAETDRPTYDRRNPRNLSVNRTPRSTWTYVSQCAGLVPFHAGRAQSGFTLQGARMIRGLSTTSV